MPKLKDVKPGQVVEIMYNNCPTGRVYMVSHVSKKTGKIVTIGRLSKEFINLSPDLECRIVNIKF